MRFSKQHATAAPFSKLFEYRFKVLLLLGRWEGTEGRPTLPGSAVFFLSDGSVLLSPAWIALLSSKLISSFGSLILSSVPGERESSRGGLNEKNVRDFCRTGNEVGNVLTLLCLPAELLHGEDQ